jgi:hypothetical protein
LTGWQRYFFYRRTVVKTTWTFRLALILAILLVSAIVFRASIPAIGRALVCDEQVRPSDAILIENFEPNYLVFERAGDLARAGIGSKLFVPTEAGSDGQPSRASAGFVEVLARVARLPQMPEMIPTTEVEPISLNVANQIRTVLQKEQIRSVLVVAPAFRSRRSALVYSTVFADAGISTSCVPVFGNTSPENWTRTWHGIEDVVEQSGKLLYYRFYVMPRRKNID